MSDTSWESAAPPRIEYLKVQNFRALQSVEFGELTPMTVLLGPNGSGKSTVSDVFAFLDPRRNRSRSFKVFHDAVIEAAA